MHTIFTRVSLIEAYNSVYNYDLIGIVETHLDSTVDESKLDLTGYSFLKVTVNVFWMKLSIFRFFHIPLAELSRHTMIPCLKPTEVLKMEEISCK